MTVKTTLSLVALLAGLSGCDSGPAGVVVEPRQGAAAASAVVEAATCPSALLPPPAGAEASHAPPVEQASGARIIAVASARELCQAIARAQPGDVIEIQDGQYVDVQVHLPEALRGTPDRPIILRARHRYQAVFGGGSYFHVEGRYLIIQGLAFRGDNEPQGQGHANFATCIYLGGNHNRATDCRFDNCGEGGAKAWRHIVHVPNTASDNRVDCNLFMHSLCICTGLQSDGSPRRNAFTHNVIDGNDTSAPKDFRVAIQIGQHYPCDERTETLVEYNTIRHFDGPESIGIKSSACIVRHNLVTDSNASLGVRAGSDNEVTGNVILHCMAGIMITGRGQKVEDNYVLLDRPEGGIGAVYLHHEAWKDGYVGGPPLIGMWDQASKHTTVEDFIKANTFANNRFWRAGATSPEQVRVAGGLLGHNDNRAEDPRLPEVPATYPKSP